MIIIELLQSTLKQFAEITNDSGTTSNEATVNATVKEVDGQTYVQIDGSDQFTPIETTVKLSDGERVMVLLKNHTATVTGNSTSPSVRTVDLDDLVTVIDSTIVAKINGFEININEANKKADDALGAVDDAAKTATNYITGNSSGLVVGYQVNGSLGRNVQLTSTAVNIRNGSTTLASFSADEIQLGCNSTDSVISLCGGHGLIYSNARVVGGTGLVIASGEGIVVGCTYDDSVKVQLSPAGVTAFTSTLWLEANDVHIKGVDSDEFNGTVSIKAYDIAIGESDTYTTDAIRLTADRVSINTPLDDTSAGIYLNGGYVRVGDAGSTIRIGTSTSTIYIGGELYSSSGSGSGDPLDAYPVGAVYMSLSSTSPASLFGGTWQQISGYYPYFASSNPGGTGGAKSVTLTVDNLPSHTHGMQIQASSVFASGTNKSGYVACSSGSSSEKYSSSTGSGTSFTTYPAYYNVYAWRRTA